jgi:hypothetical protein
MQEFEVCSACGGVVRKVDSEYVCVDCGVVQSRAISMVHTLPFDQAYSPTNMLTFGKSQGDTLKPQDLLKVLSRAHHNSSRTVEETRARAHQMLSQAGFEPNHKAHCVLDTILNKVLETNLGLQARFMRISSPTESTETHRILECASQKLILLGFGDDHIISNDVGGLIRKLVGWLRFSKTPYRAPSLADAIIYYVLTDYYKLKPNPPPERNNGTIQTNVLKFREKELQTIQWFDQQWRTIKIFCDGTKELLA